MHNDRDENRRLDCIAGPVRYATEIDEGLQGRRHLPPARIFTGSAANSSVGG